MEEIKILSVKPIQSDNDTDSGNVINDKKDIQIKSASLPHHVLSKSINLYSNVNPEKSRLNKLNSSFKNVLTRASIKTHPSKNCEYNNTENDAVKISCFGRTELRSSLNERFKNYGPSSSQQFSEVKKGKTQILNSDFIYLTANPAMSNGLYKSNSSLELDHNLIEEPKPTKQFFKREYGSHGAINVDSLNKPLKYSILNDQNTVKKVLDSPPKQKFKKVKVKDKERSSVIKRLLPPSIKITEKNESENALESNTNGISNFNVNNVTQEAEMESEPIITKSYRRPAIAHYDCQSLAAAQLSPTKIKSLLSDRSNTTTGASAAVAAESESSHKYTNCKDLVSPEYKKSNQLVAKCQLFINEVGGDSERRICLSREIVHLQRVPNSNETSQLYRSPLVSAVSVLEWNSNFPNWSNTLCPYEKRSSVIEATTQGSEYFSKYFKSQDHQNWFGIDESLGPVAISIKKEKLDENGLDSNHGIPSFQFRFILRTAHLFNCQGTIREENLNHRNEKAKSLGIKEAIEYISPSLNLSCLRAGTNSKETEETLLKIDGLGEHRKFKIGIMYCRAGQRTEEDMYNNEHPGPAFSEFLEIVGQRVRLKNFDKHRGGLDKKTDSTGHYSVYTEFQGIEIMFHVSTLLPYTSNNAKQLLRKRHIGNDIVTIIFQEPGALPFSPKYIRSHFQHVFIVVQPINPCTDSTQYSIAVSRFQDVPIFGPPLPSNATFPKSKKFVDFLLAKAVNGELAALRSDKFVCMAGRTKHEYLKELAENHTTSSLLDSSSKFSLMGFSRVSKKEKSRFRFVADFTVKGALSWNLRVYDATLQRDVECIVGISVEYLVVLEQATSAVIFATSLKSVLGWTTKPKEGLHIFYHQGECLIFNLPQNTSGYLAEEILSEIVARLTCVTQGAESQQFTLKRNSAGLLGFNVQQDGIITEVEPYGLAAQSKLVQGSRLVEICKAALATLSQEQMVDLLKTSITVTVTVIPPHPDGTPRKGCNVPTCPFLLGCTEGDYENLTPPELKSNLHSRNRVKQLSRCDRSLSPPRSGNSSGYGTGSSFHSFTLEQQKLQLATQDLPCNPTYEMTGLPRNKQLNGPYLSEYGTPSIGSTHSNGKFLQNEEKSSSKFYLPKNYYNRKSPHSQSDIETSTPPPLPSRLYHPKKSIYYAGESDYMSDSSYTRPTPSLPNISDGIYEPGNYAVPNSFPRPVKDNYKCFKSLNINSDTVNDPIYDTQKLKVPHGEALKEFRRNSSPLTLDQKEKFAENSRLYRPRHSVPKSSVDSTNDRLNAGRSEDELSGSCNSSPRLLQKPRSSRCSTSSPSMSSRNHSPHSITSNGSHKGDMGPPAATGVRLKQSVQSIRNSQSRNSTSLGANNFQEELLKLINPDYLSDSESINAEIRKEKKQSYKKTHAFPTYDIQDSAADVENHSSNTSQDHSSGIYESLPFSTYETIGETEFSNRKKIFTKSFIENKPLIDDGEPKKTPGKDFTLTARPATVISNSSANSSPAWFDAKEKLSPQSVPSTINNAAEIVTVSAHEKNDISLPKNDISPPTNGILPVHSSIVLNDEWKTLVNVATLAIDPEKQSSGLPVEKSSEEALKTDQNPLNLSAEFMNSVPAKFHKDMPKYFEQFLASTNVNSSANGDATDTNGNETPLAVVTLPETVDESTRNLVQQLERALASEQRLSGKLKQEVSYLRNENSKLLRDSRAAAHKLHQFTEWFFKNVHDT